MNVSAFKVTILYMFVHVNDIFYCFYICTYIFINMKKPGLLKSGISFMSVYSAV